MSADYADYADFRRLGVWCGVWSGKCADGCGDLVGEFCRSAKSIGVSRALRHSEGGVGLVSPTVETVGYCRSSLRDLVGSRSLEQKSRSVD